ncbi:hypothetical protein GALMADRAFT_257167 [Galerina marginata CBS 339.88]|uniref:Fungal lipase-type domain-containing protein n=1 Tax=Galerina marginata (strain CBS 339.88) TaxID=685588 RepID=A0A067SL89_GALM3|nr:hypothetical protein GALMADRAFT_257167 [Galerina marginata CBS 339.88]
MLKSLASSIRGSRQVKENQHPSQEAEREENFRWLSKYFAASAPRPLKLSDRVDASLQNELSEIGQFAEVAHGSFDPRFLWKYMANLCESGYPLYQYLALAQSELVSVFYGTVSNLQCYIAYRPDEEQLVVAFSGTSSLAQAGQALNATKVRYQWGEETYVHAGFWKMYTGIRTEALSKLGVALKQYSNIQRIVLTGHSMGAVMASLLCLDVLQGQIPGTNGASSPSLPLIKMVGFGAPRVGNDALAQLWNELTSRPGVEEYSIRNYNDGVPVVPPRSLGYRHLSRNPLYLSHSQLWRISQDQSEHSLFKLDPEATLGAQNPYPMGGHNYYNDRNIELLQRRMEWFQPHAEDDTWDTLKHRFDERLQEVKQQTSLSKN